jgi:hypothetical protein
MRLVPTLKENVLLLAGYVELVEDEVIRAKQ